MQDIHKHINKENWHKTGQKSLTLPGKPFDICLTYVIANNKPWLNT